MAWRLYSLGVQGQNAVKVGFFSEDSVIQLFKECLTTKNRYQLKDLTEEEKLIKMLQPTSNKAILFNIIS